MQADTGRDTGGERMDLTWSGQRLGPRFCVIEHEEHLDPALTFALLCDELDPPCVAYVVRGAVAREHCEHLVRNFWRVVEQRGSSRAPDDVVDVRQVGATQYGASSAAYVERATRTRTDVESLFEGLAAAGREQVLQERFFATVLTNGGIDFAPAEYKGVTVPACAARSWRNLGAYSLEPHEDRAQLRAAREDGFEIGRAHGPLVVMATLTDHHSGGELVVWDWAPDDDARTSHGVLATGYPYPHAIEERFPSIEIAMRAGDLVLLRGNFVHAVRATARPGRVSVSRFIGRVEPQRVVHWT